MAQIERVISGAKNRSSPSAGEKALKRKTPRPDPVHGSSLNVDSVPTIELDPQHLEKGRVILGYENAAAVAAYKMLRTRILQRMRSNQWTTLAITSPTQENGKSLTALNLAISMAMEQRQKVVLVDLDLRNPDINSLLGMGDRLNFAKYMEEKCDVEEVLVRPANLSSLYVVPNSKVFEYSSELLASPQMAELIDQLKTIDEDQIIIFDLPPLTVDDVLAFMPNVDATLMVVAERVTRREDLLDAKELLEEYNVIGTVLNMSNETAPSYY